MLIDFLLGVIFCIITLLPAIAIFFISLYVLERLSYNYEWVFPIIILVFLLILSGIAGIILL